MIWTTPVSQEEMNAARPAAEITAQLASDLVAHMQENVRAAHANDGVWTGTRLAGLFLAAAWQASKDIEPRMAPEDFVGMIRAHAAAIEDLLL